MSEDPSEKERDAHAEFPGPRESIADTPLGEDDSTMQTPDVAVDETDGSRDVSVAPVPPPPPPPPRRDSIPAIPPPGATGSEISKPRKSKGPQEIYGPTGASQLPPAPIEKIEAIAAAVSRLRAEVDATTDKARRARLLVEAAEIQESGADESGAARDYLASYNSDTSFREPLEGLVRLLERRRSLSNVGKLIEQLVAAASTPEERARALTQRGIFFEDVQRDLEGARGMAREATETGAIPAELGSAWLLLEQVSAKLGDAAQREEALAGRAQLTEHPSWRGLLLLDVARLAAAAGETDRAVEILIVAREDGGRAGFLALTTTARLLRSDPGLPGSADARSRSRILAETLEALAEMIRKAMSTTETITTELEGVPLWCRTTPHVADLFLSAADARRACNDNAGAARLLDRALEVLEEAAPRHEETTASTEVHREATAAMSRIAVAERMRVAERMGDTALAAELAERRIVGETDGGFAAALSMRIAEHAASEGDTLSAIAALGRATERDPASAPARALAIDLLEASEDGAGFAEELEELSRHCGSGDAQGRALLLAAYVWATRAEDRAHAREALGQAEACGVGKETIARMGRSLAALRGDKAWYEDATQALIDHLLTDAGSHELPLLWVELARLKLAHGDEAGAAKATAALRDLPEGAWIGRALDALSGGELDPARARVALDELANEISDPAQRRGLLIVSAMRARAAGDEAGAVAHLEELTRETAADPVVAAYLSDLFRLTNDRAAAARVAATAAEAMKDDPELAAARHLEAGFEKWRLGDRLGAVTSFEAASNGAPESAKIALAWSARGVEIDSIEGRRTAIARAGQDPGTALERFALEAAMGDPDEAGNALALAFGDANPQIKLAAALGWLAWPKGTTDPEALSAALDVLAEASPKTKAAAAAERVRIAREGGGDAIEAAEGWLRAGGGLPAAIEWLAAAMASGEHEREVPARRALAEVSSDEAREAFAASATLFAWVQNPDADLNLIGGSSPAVLLTNLELSPPGSEPRRRATALSELDGALGDETETDAMGLAGWSVLAAGEPAAALDVFRAVTSVRPADLHAWEGLRSAAEDLNDQETYAKACEELGARCLDPARGAAFWEQAALAWSALGGFEAKIEPALDASFQRDPTRAVAFDRLFRRVRERKDADKLLDLIERRLAVTDDPNEIAKLYWEQARVLREKGDPEAALEALEHVTTFDDNHVGALALTGEIFIKRGMFAEAAEKLAKLSRVEAAPAKNRVTAGVAAVDLYENKLSQPDKALEVLVELHRAGLTTLPVRERMARTAARTGAWAQATRILEELMMERPEKDGRVEAARLALAIHRDRLNAPAGGIRAASKLLEESPTDTEALELVVNLDASVRERRPLLERSRDTLLMGLHGNPTDVEAERRLARVARALGDNALEQAALSSAIALGGPDGSSEQMVAVYSSRKPRLPQVSLSESMIRQILAPGDEGPIADLFVALGPTLGEALGPTRESLGVTKKERVDPRSGLALRTEIAQWAGAFGIQQFDLYIGGRDPSGIQAIAGETPALVVGASVNAPLSTTTRARLVRELFGLVRGTTVARWRDETGVAAIAIAACNIVKVRVDAPAFPSLAETQKAIDKAIARRTKGVIEPICRAFAASGVDARQWATRARSSQSRAGLIASGDVVLVLADLFGESIDRLPAMAKNDPRAHELLRFTLSRPYFDLRRALGLEVQT
jgi:tetratricopeptide (TPR) repeat protein